MTGASTSGAVPGLTRHRMIEVPDAVASELHLRHGWSMLESVRERLGGQCRFQRHPQLSAIINLPAMVVVALVTALLVIGIKESARVNNVIVFIKVSILVLLIALGLRWSTRKTGAARSSRIG